MFLQTCGKFCEGVRIGLIIFYNNVQPFTYLKNNLHFYSLIISMITTLINT